MSFDFVATSDQNDAMPRKPRFTVPYAPHHVTQRGNRGQQTFFCDDDYRLYLRLMAEACRNYGVAVWAYCLMPNHSHLVMVPSHEQALTRAVADVHERYTKAINFRHGWQGYLWQGRFFSSVMDEAHLAYAVRYVELNPVRAGLCAHATQYPWSSARAHVAGQDDALVTVKPMLERVWSWDEYLATEEDQETLAILRRATRTGRPIASREFIEQLERETGRQLLEQRRGRRKKIGTVVCP